MNFTVFMILEYILDSLNPQLTIHCKISRRAM